jgi:cyclopropane-fatty-acyl-phospholipid synthase
MTAHEKGRPLSTAESTMTSSPTSAPVRAVPANRPGRADGSRLLRPAAAAPTPTASGGVTDAVARRLGLRLLAGLHEGRLEIVEADGREHVFGDVRSTLSARLEVRDQRAWRALLVAGSVGFGRGFVEGWWTADDPTAVTRIAIRNLGRLDDLRTSSARLTGPLLDAWSRLRPPTTRRRNRDDIMSHYDIGNEFFSLFLDETMTYSCAVFDRPDDALADASEGKYRRLLDKLAVGADHRLLEIGSGWGGLAIHAARGRGCSVTTTTISPEQAGAVRRRVAEAGAADHVEALELDWRDLPSLGRRFDRVVSIEMIEAVEWRDYRRYFDVIERCLRPDGMVGMQAICIPDRRFQSSKHHEDFIKRYIFPGGMLPSTGALVDAACGKGRLQLLDVDDLTRHYAETLRRWRARLDEHAAEVIDLGLDERFLRLWRMYLSYCEAAFLERHCTVQQLVFVGPEWRGELTTRPV